MQPVRLSGPRVGDTPISWLRVLRMQRIGVICCGDCFDPERMNHSTLTATASATEIISYCSRQLICCGQLSELLIKPVATIRDGRGEWRSSPNKKTGQNTIESNFHFAS